MRKFEQDYDIGSTTEVVTSERRFRRDVDLRLDALEQRDSVIDTAAREVVDRAIRFVELEIAPRAAEIEEKLADFRDGVPAASVQEEVDGRQFLTPDRRAAILGDLRGGVGADYDTLAKLVLLIATKSTPADITSAINALKGSAPAIYDTLQEIAAWIANDETAEAALTTAIGNRLRIDTAGSYTTAQIDQARANLLLPASSVPFGFRNRIINGDMRVDQRNNGGAKTFVAGAAFAYCIDRWLANSDGANVTGQRVAGSGDAQYRYRFTGAAGITEINFLQRIEAANCCDLAGKTVTLSFDMSNSLLSTLTVQVWHAAALDDWGTATNVYNNTAVPISAEVTRHALQIAIPANAKNGLLFQFVVGAQTGGTWVIGDVQVELGSIATPFERRPYGYELGLCERYYQAIDGVAFNGVVLVPTQIIFTSALRTRMRTSSTMTLLKTSYLASNYDLFVGGALVTNSNATIASASNYSAAAVTMTLNGFTGLTAGQTALINSVENVLALSAEL
jgi:hypothetical protein